MVQTVMFVRVVAELQEQAEHLEAPHPHRHRHEAPHRRLVRGGARVLQLAQPLQVARVNRPSGRQLRSVSQQQIADRVGARRPVGCLLIHHASNGPQRRASADRARPRIRAVLEEPGHDAIEQVPRSQVQRGSPIARVGGMNQRGMRVEELNDRVLVAASEGFCQP